MSDQLTVGGVLHVHDEVMWNSIVSTPNRLICVETTKEGISACIQIRRYYEQLARENAQHIFCVFDAAEIPSLAQKINIFPVFRFYINGKMVQECHGGIELSLKTNFERSLKLYLKTMNPPKKKDKGKPEDLYVFGKKVETKKGEVDQAWVPDNMRVHALPTRPAGERGAVRPAQSSPPASPRSPRSPRAASPQETRPAQSRPQQHQSYPQDDDMDLPEAVQRQPVRASPQQHPRAVSPQQSQQPRGAHQAPIRQASPHMVPNPRASEFDTLDDLVDLVAPLNPAPPPEIVFAHVVVGGPYVWALDVEGGVWRHTGEFFEEIPGKLTTLSVGSDGSVWGTDHLFNIYRRTEGGWQQVRGRLKSVSVSDKNTVWGVTPEGVPVNYLGGGQWQAMA